MWRGLALILCLACATPLASEPQRCDDPLFSVETGDAALRDEICTVAPAIRDALAACGLVQHRPLTIEVDSRISHPVGDCLAYFDCVYDMIHVTHPEAFGTHLAEDTPYAALPSGVLLRALLTHEMAHALLTQTAGTREVATIDQEYVAAALEMELMETDWRDVLLAASPVSLPPKEGLIDILIYGLAPRKFAVNAWQHFSLQENGCALVRRIAEGTASFANETRAERR